MSIAFKNDGKGKHQSWSAEVELTGSTLEGTFSITLTAYGASKDEAGSNFDRLAQSSVLAICEAASEAHADSIQAAIDADNGGRP